VAITNSTISDNVLTFSTGPGGGGFCTGGITVMRHVTVAGNSAGTGGGALVFGSGTLDLGNSIIAGNSGGAFPDIRRESNAFVTTSGFNLIGINASVEATFPAGNPNANNDIVGTASLPMNPRLAALAATTVAPIEYPLEPCCPTAPL
jgi:hypothetical protein